MQYALFCLVALIPFQPRYYKCLRTFSASLINHNWNLPSYFERHVDLFIADFFLLGILMLGAFRIRSWKSMLWDGEKKYLTIFLLTSLVSIIHSHQPLYLLHYWRLVHLILPAGLFFIFRDSLPFSFQKLAKVVVSVTLLEAVIAITQYFVQHSLGLKALGEPTLIARQFIGPSVPISDGSVWIFDRIFHPLRHHSFILRASGTLSHPNILGGILVFGLCMSYYLYTQISKRRIWLGFVIAIQLFALFITYSRSALYMWAMVTGLWILVTSWKEKKLSSLLFVTGGFFLLSLALLYPQLFARGGVVSYTQVSEGSDVQRLALHQIGWAMIKGHPWFGVGFNSYMLALQALFEHQATEIAYLHNAYLHLAAEIGIPGLFAFLLFCSFVVKAGWLHRQKPEVLVSLCIFLAFLGVGLVDHYPVCDLSSKLIFFLSAGLIKSSCATTPHLNNRSLA